MIEHGSVKNLRTVYILFVATMFFAYLAISQVLKESIVGPKKLLSVEVNMNQILINTSIERKSASKTSQTNRWSTLGNIDKYMANKESPWQRHVLLWSYFRSGSTFMGELLAARTNSIVFNEPLRLRPAAYGVTANNKEDAITKLFRCDMSIIRRIFHSHYPSKKFLFPKSGRGKLSCQRSKTIVIKVNRMSASRVSKKWMQDKHDVKIVHLVRDPRAIISSRRFMKHMSGTVKSSKALCNKMMLDMKILSEYVPSDRYLRIRIEDFIDDPYAQTKMLYQFIDVPINSEVKGYVRSHTSKQPTTRNTLSFIKHKGGQRMSTYKNYSQVHDKWVKYLSRSDTKQIEKYCHSVMSALNYPRYYSKK